jgi:DNA helicase-2/ATP-dependent DNA helicase PcrA
MAFLDAVLTPKDGSAPPAYAGDIPGDRRQILILLDQLFAASYDGGQTISSLPNPPKWVPQLFSDYCAALVKANRFDFGALLHLAKRVIAEHPGSARMLRYGWSHICVDEFQDTNRAQYDLLRLVVAAGEKNLFVVADDDQILYQWNGASPERLLALQRDYGMTRLQLPRNYRCPSEIIDLANTLIRNNAMRTPDKSALVAERGAGEDPISVYPFDNEFEEAAGIARIIQARHLDPAECVVLARNAKILKGIADALGEAGIKAWLTQRKNEFESAPVRFFHSILRLANSRHDLEFLRRTCVSWKELGNPLVQVNDVEGEAALHGGDFLRAWISMAESAPDYAKLGPLCSHLADRPGFFEAISGFWEFFETDSDDLVREEIGVWKELDASIRAGVGVENLSLNQYLQEMDMLSKAAPRPEGAIPCITVHGAKGGEFHHVFLAGMAEEVFPSFQAVRKGPRSAEMEEERRSCFVAITRVQKTLTVTWARSYSGYAKKPSRFLKEMFLV